MEKLAKANAISKIMPKQAGSMVKNAGAGGAPANLAQSIFKKQSLIPSRTSSSSASTGPSGEPNGEHQNSQPAVNALLMTGNIRLVNFYFKFTVKYFVEYPILIF